MRFSLFGLATLLFSINLTSMGAAAPQVEDIGSLHGSERNGWLLSRDGTTAVIFDQTSSGFLRWRESAGLEPILAPPGSSVQVSGVSDDGSKIVGTIDREPVVWDTALVPTNLDLAGTGFSQASVQGISGDGTTVFGSLEGVGSFGRAFRWTASGGAEDIHPPIYENSHAIDVSLDGSVILMSGRRVNSLRQTSFVWTAAGGATEVLVPTQSATFLFELNDAGTLAAGMAVTGIQRDLIRWTQATGPVIVASDAGTAGYPFHISRDCSTIIGKDVGFSHVWTETGGYTALPSIPQVYFRAVSDDGSMLFGFERPVGHPNSIQTPFMWPVVNGTVNLADRVDLPRANGIRCEVTRVSGDGAVALGQAQRADGTLLPALWRTSGSIGRGFCGPAQPNSATLGGARMILSGSNILELGALELRAAGLPAHTLGFFIGSPAQQITPQPGGSQGDLCLGGSIGRFVGPGQVLNSGAVGTLLLEIDPNALPSPTGFVAPTVGVTWTFQAWFRDTNPGLTSNFTDAAAVAFY